MIPQAAITRWRNTAPWPRDAQVEQDLVLCRALVEIFQEPSLAKALLVRGGTALHKLYVKKPLRYSEDIDLVQRAAGPIGPVLNAIRGRLDPLFGEPRWERKANSVILRYRMESEIPPVVPMRLKLEINTREHFAVFGTALRPLEIRSAWFEGRADIPTYTPDELLATKMRALYQRRKGRDLFDLGRGMVLRGISPKRIVAAFRRYMSAEKHNVSAKAFRENIEAKAVSRQFNEDIKPLLAPGVRYNPKTTARAITRKLLPLLS